MKHLPTPPWPARPLPLALAAALLGGAAPLAAAHDDWPSKPITIVVTFPPGGGTDLLARKLAPELEQALGQPVVVENRAGASGNIGASHVGRAAADGHTLLMVNSSFAINPAVLGTPDFDPARDFRAVINVGFIPSVLVVPQDSPVHTLPALLAERKHRQTPLFFASCGNGTPQHLAGTMLQPYAPTVKFEQVPYKGCGPAVADVLGGQVALGIVTASSAMPMLASGRLRAIAVTSPERSPLLPAVPTVAEQGLPGYALDQWHGLLAPAATPDTVIERLNAVLAAALQRPGLRRQLQDLGYHVSDDGQARSDAFAQLLRQDLQRFAQLGRSLGPQQEAAQRR
ncbi:tripartite tricarboxylate transporter substrate binding protein [Corticibacter populi]|uniref:Tripartite tricarboxylate transporter substrate binding protein n=1 Tax=Corticibacter populi TaxID=1550736 RepID=A0A3M6QQE8_9BURK|nr:tripartite tricarboxylate transporter substrate binding protein [Corticibacter populi]RMX04779.1 tripartite tricarboxylate transporter substrate binding protein [Corticibacter populi]RZS33809.1 tripartite-type tricarboxylate transporter receptor subunit TctC [Corticibacter populi]